MATGAPPPPRRELQLTTMAKKNEETKNEDDHDHDKENGNNNDQNDQQPHDWNEDTDDEDHEDSHDNHNDSDDNDDDLESVIQGEEELVTFYEEMNQKKKKALLDFRCRVEDSVLGNYLLGKPNQHLSRTETLKQKETLREITLWGVPLLPSKGHEGTDIVLLKFLRARDFKVHDAFQMLRRTLKWRKEYKTDEILEEKLGSDVGNMLCLNGRDREGRPLCYSVYGAFRDREFYKKAFGSEEKCDEFLRWRIQCMEKGIKELEFKNGGVDSILHISDFKNSPWPLLKGHCSVSKKALVLFQENYPELIHKIIVINAPLWYYVLHMLRSRFSTQNTERKFVFTRATKVTKTLLKYIAAESLPVQYGGLNRENDDEFSPLDEASELKIKGNSTAYIEFPVSEAGSTMVWDLSVVGWDVSYKEEFIPDDEGSYKILLQNQTRTGENVRNSFYISEPGKITITIDNGTFKKKRVLYRFKAKPTVPMYIFLKKE